jgi:hypothetical protein
MSSGKRIVNLSKATCATSGEGSPHLPEHLSLPPGFWWGSCGSVFSFFRTMVCLFVFCRLTIVLPVLQFTSYKLIWYFQTFRTKGYSNSCYSHGIDYHIVYIVTTLFDKV